MSDETTVTTLAVALESVAARLDVAPTTVGEMTTWSVGDRIFATLGRDVASFRLDGPIAAAARRTPDTSGSDRGADWVAFTPPVLDPHAVDRIDAWFEAAHRRAG